MYVLQLGRDDKAGIFVRLVDSEDKESELLNTIRLGAKSPRVYQRLTSSFAQLREKQLVYWVRTRLIQMLASSNILGKIANVPKGLSTGENDRFIRFHWEAPFRTYWKPYAKGGGYRKWQGLQWLVLNWSHNGARIKHIEDDKGGIRSRVQNELYYHVPGFTYTEVANKSLGVRLLSADEYFDARSPGIVPSHLEYIELLAVLNCRISTYFFRCLSPGILLDQAYAPQLPIPAQISNLSVRNATLVACQLKMALSSCQYEERTFDYSMILSSLRRSITFTITSHLVSLEAWLEKQVFKLYELGEQDEQDVLLETGTPAGFHPLIIGYDALPDLPSDLDLPLVPKEVLDYLAAHERIAPSATELRRIKERLRGLYEAGPGVKEADEPTESEADGDDEGEGAASGAHIPIPTETFQEELSVKMQLHPISVYWLLEELRREGARCKPEERRLLEDRLSVLTLRLLGHRWPKQIEAGEPVPDWADADGIVPLTPGAGQATLAERLRQRLRAEDDATGAQRAEALLVELTGLGLEEWLRREFFRRHMRQFKYRPIAWHLASKPIATARAPGRRSAAAGRQFPAFECLLYYHACAGDVMARIRTQYVEPLLRAERQRMESARRANQETESAQAQTRIQELEDFNARLTQVAEGGFESPELAKLLADEPLDRWDGGGYIPPMYQEDLLRQERAWRVDLNDGVRVNIAPVQLAGLLAGDVLKVADAKKAIADRARWRSDERRWVRAGKLPRCGWMDDAVPESPEWTKLAPQRAAERAKLAAKRQAALGKG